MVGFAKVFGKKRTFIVDQQAIKLRFEVSDRAYITQPGTLIFGRRWSLVDLDAIRLDRTDSWEDRPRYCHSEGYRPYEMAGAAEIRSA